MKTVKQIEIFTKTYVPTVPDFLRVGEKTQDLRYGLYEGLKETDDDHRSEIFWIGALRTSNLDPKNKYIEFVNENGKFEIDQHIVRNIDGTPTTQIKKVCYSLATIKEQMKKHIDYKFFNVLINERVYRDGKHSVCILFNQNNHGSPKFGIPTEKAWINMPFWEVYKEIDSMRKSGLSYMNILTNERYEWKKQPDVPALH